jgi:hypothetical protein
MHTVPTFATKNTNVLIARYQTAPQIAAAIVTAVKESEQDAQKIGHFFYSQNKKQTAKLIFIFLKKLIPYDKEPASRQTARTLGRILNESNKGGDCKHFATAAAALCKANGIKCKLRLIAQVPNSKTPNHIYCVAVIAGNDVIIDPVLKNFDTEANYIYKYDINI